jgi:glycine dehydrogenase subunit 1
VPFVLNTQQDREAMLKAIGASSIEELFEPIPAALRMNRPLDIPPAMSELELTDHAVELASKNISARQAACFLGGGCYDHFIPAAVDTLASRGEFYTSYTPYQAEASQGNLQALFEYQTLITALTGMDVANASLYDGATAATEAVLMSLAATRRTARVVTTSAVHPEYRQVLETYLANRETEVVTVDAPHGMLTPEALAEAIDDQTACVLVQHPNFFGNLEQVNRLAEITHAAGALFIVAVDPMSLGLLKRPGDYGADIVVAEGQGLGNPMSFGGPFLGIMACREKFLRGMPGRVTGQTTDRHGNRCWVLTLQTREQHIRREKATSNICTNQGLLALRATIYLSLMGPEGMREAGDLCLRKAHYAAQQLCADDRFELAFPGPFFKEFVVRDSRNRVEELVSTALDSGLMAGIPLGRWYPHLEDCLLVTVTERRTRAEIDRLTASFHWTVSEEAPCHAQ